MSNNISQTEFELLCIIVNFGSGSKVIKFAKKNGIIGGTIFLARGTANNKILKFFDVDEVRKEIVIIIAEKNIAEKFLYKVNHIFKFDKPNHGVAFSSTVVNIIGARNFKCSNYKKYNGGEETKMHNAIYVIVDKGKADDVMNAAQKAGSKGGTIINARGSGIHENNTLFSMEIEPEKEIVLIIADDNTTDKITSMIRKELKIDKPGNGIIYIQSVNNVYGLY